MLYTYIIHSIHTYTHVNYFFKMELVIAFLGYCEDCANSHMKGSSFQNRVVCLFVCLFLRDLFIVNTVLCLEEQPVLLTAAPCFFGVCLLGIEATC